MSVYIIARINIHDREGYANYENGFVEAFAPHNGRILSVDEAPKVVEGSWSVTRTVLIEFPSEAEAMAWYESDAYQTIVKHRHKASDGDIVMVQSFG